jgi:hypothetical protein
MCDCVKRIAPMRLILLALIIIFGTATAQPQTNTWSRRIASKTKHPLPSLLSLCPTDVNILVVDGKRFERVRGIKKFYLPVPGTNAIFFVVDEKDYSVTYHFFNMSTDEDIAIHCKSSYFGRTIGSPNCNETINRDSNGNISLCKIEQGGGSVLPELANLATTKWLCDLDLKARRVTSQKSLYFDRNGKLLSEYDESPPITNRR